MLDDLLRNFGKFCLWLRYRIRVRGLNKVAARGRRGILFLPNHPALIDPIMLMCMLHHPFRARALADPEQLDRFFVRWAGRRGRVIPILDMAKHGFAARGQVETAIARCVEALRAGDNLLLYPSGHICRRRTEELRGNSAVERILREVPDARANGQGVGGDVGPEDLGPSVRRVQESQEDAKERGLAGAVGSQKSHDAARDLQCDAVERPHTAEGFLQVVQTDHRSVSGFGITHHEVPCIGRFRRTARNCSIRQTGSPVAPNYPL